MSYPPPKLDQLYRTDRRGRALFRLTAPYVYWLGADAKITVPEGYVTNYGTIPRIASWIISPTELRELAIVHDYLCGEQHDDGPPIEPGYSRWLADAVLYEGMARFGFCWLRRFAVWSVVRIFAIATGQTQLAPEPERIEVEE